MKKLLIVVAIILMSASLFARPTGLNLGGGFSLNFINSSIGGNKTSETLFGPYAEVGYDLSFTPVVGMYFGARYNVDLRLEVDRIDAGMKGGYVFLSDLSAPIQVSFNIPAGKSSIFINVGPTLNCWLGYRSLLVTTDIDQPIIYENLFDKNVYNRFNISAGGSVGVNIKKHVKIYGAYDQSLFNYMKSSDCKRSSGLLRIGAAYVF